MTTTVAVAETTQQRLALLKEEWELSSYDEVIRKLLAKVQPIPESMFGSSPDLPPLNRRERRDALGEEKRYRRR